MGFVFMSNKRGQFFLLAAVIISVVVMGFGVKVNQVTFVEEPKNFYDFSYEVKREVGEVIDYDVYTDFDGSADLDKFVELMSEDIKERSPDSNFLFIYGDDNNISLRSYEGSSVADDKRGFAEGSKVCLRGFCKEITSDLDYKVNYDFDDSDDEIVVEMNDNNYTFPVSESRQVLFIIQKNVGEESYVSVR
jgi:hypothetical protein